MKIKVKESSLEEAMQAAPYKNKRPRIQMLALKKLVEIIAKGDMKKTNFTVERINMDKVGLHPCLILMNHSSFIDLEMAFHLFKGRRFSIIATDDGFIGKEKLLRGLGCIPTRKFMYDVTMVKNMIFSLHKLHQSILMYPEASYTFDGTETALPKTIGKCIKLCKVPVVIVKTDCGNYLRDPLYNNLQVRKSTTHAKVECILSKDDIDAISQEDIQALVESKMKYNHFKDQYEKKILVTEDFRADYLNRILYKCPTCNSEGETEGKGITLTCKSCGSKTTLLEDGTLDHKDFKFIPDWYLWERNQVKEEIINNTYHMHEEVEIYIFRDYKALYHIGSGVLDINKERYALTFEDKEIFMMSTKNQYSLYSDYYWYELGDVICIGDNDTRYYCVIKSKKDVVAKARLAQEEMYKLFTK